MLDFRLTKFSNGLKLVTAPMGHSKAVTVLFLVGVGSRYETKELNGMSHFLEHMFFKGTEKRPNTLDISKALDSVGASYNAFTGEENTGFYVRAAAEHFDLAIDVLSDMLYGSKFDATEIEREKGVILEEINMYQDVPQSYVYDVTKKLLFGDHPLGRETVGAKETIKSFKRDDFVAYRNKFYSPHNMIVVIAGGQNGGNWEKKTAEIFEKVPVASGEDCQKIENRQTKPELLIHQKKTDQAHMVLGFRSLPRTDPRRPILKVMNNLFGENMSSRLFIEIRERRGLAYYVGSELGDFQDTGLFAAGAGVDLARAEDAVKVILEEFGKLKNTAVTSEELKRAKENLKGKLYLGLEESFAVADFLAEQELFWHKMEDAEKMVADYEKVTAEDIQNLAKELFVPANLNLAMIAPFENNEKFQKILEAY
jgi:predicted Zn-dependent peptidase